LGGRRANYSNPGDTMPDSPDCTRHEDEISRLREKTHTHANDITALKRDQVNLAERIPPNLGQWMGSMDVQIRQLVLNMENVHQALQRGYVTVAEFEAAQRDIAKCATKTELEPIKSLFNKGLAAVMLTIIGGLMALLFKG